MRTTLLFLTLNVSCILYGQIIPDHPDLGLNGVITWVDSTHIIVEYDWSDDSQLLDWRLTSGSTLVRENGTVTITNGNVEVRAMIWKQGIKCTRIIAKNAAPVSSEGHLNFYSNLLSFDGAWLPNPGLGAVLTKNYSFWTHDGIEGDKIGAPLLVVGVSRDYEYSVSGSGMSIKSSANDSVYSDNIPCSPELDRKIALGGFEGNTRWGKITIEGEVIFPWQSQQVPPDVMNIQSIGSVFAPVIEVVGNPIIEWIFDDSTTSSSSSPSKVYGSEGSRHNYLKVTPWSSLIGINVGYDASDGGYGGFALVDNQNVLGFQNLDLAKNSLRYLCANYNPLKELDIRGFSQLEFVELYHCYTLDTLKLSIHPVLERICVEDCNLATLDISGCSGLEDLRGALNSYTSINWGSTGEQIWHICIRDNPQLSSQLPDLTQFPLLRELLNWNDSQTGAFVCHSSIIETIQSSYNDYTSANISGCTNLRIFELSGSQLEFLDIGTANNLNDVRLNDCGLIESQIDYVLQTLDEAGLSNGNLELSGNAAPSVENLVHYINLKEKGWTIIITQVPISSITVIGTGGETNITMDSGTLQLRAIILPDNATEKTLTWSIINVTGQATIDTSNVVTAIDTGTVTARATANDGSGVYGNLIITISTGTGNIINNGKTEPLKIIATRSELKILLNDEFISWKADLYNLQGGWVFGKLVESNVLVTDISFLSAGIYILNLSKGDKILVSKVFKP